MKRELIGEHFVNLHDLSFEQAEKVLRVQKKNKKRKFGEIAVKLGFLELKKLDKYLDGPLDSVIVYENSEN
ncbi:MAG: hypothetical protein KAR21_25905 [Spirochaetales bacterium]|nr:hypothetical protein [Spirochaetales bacterium]